MRIFHDWNHLSTTELSQIHALRVVHSLVNGALQCLRLINLFVDGRVAGHLGDAVGLKMLRIHVCVCPHFGM